MSCDLSGDQLNTSNWEQFEQFRKKITQECQSDEKHFKIKRDSYTSLEKIKKSPTIQDEQEYSIAKPPILVQPSETDRIIKLRMENQELKEKLEEINKGSSDLNAIKESHAKQLKSQKEYYEIENTNLKSKINQFNEELEDLKKVYKEKNMKLYNLVLQLEQEKQELIEKNIALLESQSTQKQNINIHHLVEERTRVMAEQVEQLEERNAKLSIEKAKIEEKYIQLLSQPQQLPQKQKISRSSDRKPPIPLENRSQVSQSFESLPPMQKSILKNSSIKQKEKENQIAHVNTLSTSRSKVPDTPKRSERKSSTNQSAQKKPTKTKKQVYSKVK